MAHEKTITVGIEDLYYNIPSSGYKNTREAVDFARREKRLGRGYPTIGEATYYAGLKSQVGDTKSEEDLIESERKEIEKYDIPNQDWFIPYLQNLEKVDQFARRHIPPNSPNARELRHRLLETSGLRGGQTNFWANPYESMSPRMSISHDPVNLNKDSTSEAYVSGINPEHIALRPTPTKEGRYSPTSRILTHEGLHGQELALLMRRSRVTARDPLGEKRKQYDWEPSFSQDFMREISRTSYNNPKHPLSGYESGVDPAHTFVYLAAREGELRKGQTLMDDPLSRRIFSAYPGMYEEYTKAKQRLSDRYKTLK